MTGPSPFSLAVCAEMLWRDRPIEWRAAHLKELGFGVGLWELVRTMTSTSWKRRGPPSPS